MINSLDFSFFFFFPLIFFCREAILTVITYGYLHSARHGRNFRKNKNRQRTTLYFQVQRGGWKGGRGRVRKLEEQTQRHKGRGALGWERQGTEGMRRKSTPNSISTIYIYRTVLIYILRFLTKEETCSKGRGWDAVREAAVSWISRFCCRAREVGWGLLGEHMLKVAVRKRNWEPLKISSKERAGVLNCKSERGKEGRELHI